MSNLLKILFWLLIWMKQETETGIAAKMFAYHRDMSEHCRRRVMPSVFLGRRVVDAYSQVLHFSRIDLPYSCYINVRTESGSNIILVLQLVSDLGHVKPCQESPNQLLVYEMGETFGGYWGPLPEIYMRPRRNRTPAMIYTLKTSASTTRLDKSIQTTTIESTPVTEDTTTPQFERDITEQQDFIELNIPLVNVSAIVVADQPDKVFSFDGNFHLYNVMPRENVSYRTSIMPLAQVSLEKQKSGRLGGTINITQRYSYKFDYNFPFTPDIRLTYPRVRGVTLKKILFPKYTFYRNRQRKPLLTKRPLLAHRDNRPYIKRSKSPFQRLKTTGSIYSKTDNDVNTSTEINFIHAEPMREFNESINYTNVSDNKKDLTNITPLLVELSKMGHNASAYLYPQFNNLSRSNLNTSVSTTKHEVLIEDNNSFIDPSLSFTLQSEQTVNTISEILKTEQLEINEVNLNNTHSGSQFSDLQININSSDTIEITDDQKTETTNFLTANVIEGNYTTKSATLSTVSLTQRARKKRHLQVVPIDNAKPHKLTTKETVPTTVSTTYHISDIQDFFGLVELHDDGDEFQDRVTLRYLRQDMGPSVFNICEFTEPKARRMQLFNSSSIVIALSNFTIEKLTVVMTPARTLLSGELRCGTSTLECQISGTRVCIDSMSACDGVPNCGAYDTFDEDRLMCGAPIGLQHNMWLAAVTFIAVMLTVLYTVHYWLKRCVPKVSEAFFIYTDRDENTLRLDSIMRSPNDIYDGPMYRNVQDEIPHLNKRIKTTTCCIWITKFFKKIKVFKKEDDSHDNSEHQFHPAKKIYSFTKAEISEIMNKDFTDVCVQTGESLEMSNLGIESLIKISDKRTKGLDFRNKQSSVLDCPMEKWDITPSLESEDISFELSLLKLFKDSKDSDKSESKEAFLNLTLESNSDHRLRGSDEREIQSHVYDRTRGQIVFPTTSSIQTVTTVSEMPSDIIAPKLQPKRLRFTEEPVTIHTTINEEEIEEKCFDRRIVEKGLNKDRTDQELKSNKEEGGQVPSRDFKRFFSSSKGKKSKNKKSQMSLH